MMAPSCLFVLFMARRCPLFHSPLRVVTYNIDRFVPAPVRLSPYFMSYFMMSLYTDGFACPCTPLPIITSKFPRVLNFHLDSSLLWFKRTITCVNWTARYGDAKSVRSSSAHHEQWLCSEMN